MDASTTEFSFLPDQAAALGAAVPPVRRVDLELADGRTLSALRYGSGMPRVTLLHGAGLNAHTWDATVLAAGVDALAIDLAGHGHSSWRDDAGYLPRTLAADVITALEAWTDGPQLLVGQSLGGLTAAAVAAERPDLVTALVVVDILPGIDPTGGPAALRAFFAGPTEWASRDELVDKAIAFGLGGDRRDVERGVFLNTRVRPDGRIEWRHHFAHLAAAAGEAGPEPADAAPDDTLVKVVDASGWDDLAAVTAPVTLVRAARGFLQDADIAQLQERLPAASVLVADAGHNVQEEQPAWLGAVIRGNTPDAGGVAGRLTTPDDGASGVARTPSLG